MTALPKSHKSIGNDVCVELFPILAQVLALATEVYVLYNAICTDEYFILEHQFLVLQIHLPTKDAQAPRTVQTSG